MPSEEKKSLLGSAIGHWLLTNKIEGFLSKTAYVSSHAEDTHATAHVHISMWSALQRFLTELSVMADKGFLVIGMKSISLLFPLGLWPLTSLPLCGALDDSWLWIYPSAIIEFIHTLFLKASFSPLWPEGDSMSVSVFAIFHLPSHFHLLNTLAHATPAQRERNHLLVCCSVFVELRFWVMSFFTFILCM